MLRSYLLWGVLLKSSGLPGPRGPIKVDNLEQSGRRPCLIFSGVMRQTIARWLSNLPLPASARAGQPDAQFLSDRQRTVQPWPLDHSDSLNSWASSDTDMTQRKPGSLLKTQRLLDNSLPNSLCATLDYLLVSYFCVIVQASLLGSHVFIT